LFDKKILAIQTDWGEEYQKLTPFFQCVGITHHVSCPHTHQQNRSAERKHRHIIKVGLSLLAQAGMPLKFLESVPTSTMGSAPVSQQRSLSAPADRAGQSACATSPSVAVHEKDSPGLVAPSRSVAGEVPVINSSSGTHEILGDLQPSALESPQTRLQNNIIKPKKYIDGIVHYDRLGLLSTHEPTSFQEAMNHEEWKESMDEEFAALMRNKTWHLVPA
jgi:hypothetical protein